MSIRELKKGVMELKRAAALNKKDSETIRIQNMTDEELQEEIYKDLAELGFKSEEELTEAAKKYFAENGLRTTFYNDWDLLKYIFENEEYFEDIVLQYGKFGAIER